MEQDKDKAQPSTQEGSEVEGEDTARGKTSALIDAWSSDVPDDLSASRQKTLRSDLIASAVAEYLAALDAAAAARADRTVGVPSSATQESASAAAPWPDADMPHMSFSFDPSAYDALTYLAKRQGYTGAEALHDALQLATDVAEAEDHGWRVLLERGGQLRLLRGKAGGSLREAGGGLRRILRLA